MDDERRLLDELCQDQDRDDGAATRRPHPHTWSSERMAWLRRLVKIEGLTATEIALRLGCTRNAIIGKCRRLGIALPNAAVGHHAKSQAHKRKQRHKGPRPTIRQALITQEAIMVPFASPSHVSTSAQHRPEPAQALPLGPCTIMELDRHRCRWPLWDHVSRVPFSEQFYCGEATAAAGCPYCGEHTRMAYAHGSGVARWR
jgi:hypothetical protein